MTGFPGVARVCAATDIQCQEVKETDMKHRRLFPVLVLIPVLAPVGVRPDLLHSAMASGPDMVEVAQIPPMVTFLSPSGVMAGGPAFSLTVNGSGFVPASIVQWNGNDRATAFLGPTQLTAMISAEDVVSGGTANVSVLNPIQDGGISNPFAFTVNNPVPVVFGLSPVSARAGGQSFSLTVNGASFVPSSIVLWNGMVRPTSFIGTSQLAAMISATDISLSGPMNVSVFSPGPGGGTSGANTFGVKEPDNPEPHITAIHPNSAIAGARWISLSVGGDGFTPASTVQWNGKNRNTTFLGATQLTAAIYPEDTASAGRASITVFNPTPGGGTSNSQAFTIMPGPAPPSATGIAIPATVSAGETVLLVVMVTPGSDPASTGLGVTANLVSIGGSPTQPLYDDGSHGDVKAGDNSFSFRTTVPANTVNGKKTLPVAVTDAQGRMATASIQLTIGSPPPNRQPIRSRAGSSATSK
jgi:hypothetical protein